MKTRWRPLSFANFGHDLLPQRLHVLHMQAWLLLIYLASCTKQRLSFRLRGNLCR